MTHDQINHYGPRLFAELDAAYDAASIQACKDANMWSPKMTAAKMVEMILQAHTAAQVEAILSKPEQVAEEMVKCLQAILAAEATVPAPPEVIPADDDDGWVTPQKKRHVSVPAKPVKLKGQGNEKVKSMPPWMRASCF